MQQAKDLFKRKQKDKDGKKRAAAELEADVDLAAVDSLHSNGEEEQEDVTSAAKPLKRRMKRQSN